MTAEGGLIAVELAKALVKLLELAERENNASEVRPLWSDIQRQIKEIGKSLERLDAWNQMHGKILAALGAYSEIWETTIEYGEEGAEECSRVVRKRWENFCSRQVCTFESSFSDEQKEVIQWVELWEFGWTNWFTWMLDWQARSEESFRSNNYRRFWMYLRDMQRILHTLLQLSDTGSQREMKSLAACWRQLERGVER